MVLNIKAKSGLKFVNKKRFDMKTTNKLYDFCTFAYIK